jgi:hypothetical protein
MRYDLLLRSGRVVDPAHGRDEVTDLAIADGKIVEIADGIDGASAAELIDLSGLLVMPGIVDPHVHVTPNAAAHRMMAKVGVITAVDVSGPVEDVVRGLQVRGAGLNVACCDSRIHRAATDDPSMTEIEGALESALEAGAIGMKILGGHQPLTPDATHRVIQASNRRRAHVTFHVGTTRYGSNIEGLREAVEMTSDGSALNIAHIQGYVRGTVDHPLEEVREAIELLARAPSNVVSDSYLYGWNTNNARCIDGVPVGRLIKVWLKLLGYPATEAGILSAIGEGRARILAEEGGDTVFRSGAEGIALYRAAGGDCPISFPVDLIGNNFLLATAKDQAGEFVVDAICTDGGTYRNVTVEFGCALIQLEGLSAPDFVRKASTNPARMFGFINKGHLGVGADADITVIDLKQRRATLGIAQGRKIMVDGIVIGQRGTMLTSEAALRSTKAWGIPFEVIDTGESRLYARVDRHEGAAMPAPVR